MKLITICFETAAQVLTNRMEVDLKPSRNCQICVMNLHRLNARENLFSGIRMGWL